MIKGNLLLIAIILASFIGGCEADTQSRIWSELRFGNYSYTVTVFYGDATVESSVAIERRMSGDSTYKTIVTIPEFDSVAACSIYSDSLLKLRICYLDGLFCKDTVFEFNTLETLPSKDVLH